MYWQYLDQSVKILTIPNIVLERIKRTMSCYVKQIRVVTILFESLLKPLLHYSKFLLITR